MGANAAFLYILFVSEWVLTQASRLYREPAGLGSKPWGTLGPVSARNPVRVVGNPRVFSSLPVEPTKAAYLQTGCTLQQKLLFYLTIARPLPAPGAVAALPSDL